MYRCYLITNTVNSKRYVGITKKTVNARWSQHKYDAKRGSNHLLHRAIRKYGPESFTLTTLFDEVSYNDIMLTEMEQIVIMNTFFTTGHGYNMTAGGEGRRNSSPSAESRVKNSESNKGKHNKGLPRDPVHIEASAVVRRLNKKPTHTTPHSEKTKQRLSECNTGKKRSAESIAKQVATKQLNGRTDAEIAAAKARVGQRRTPEQRQRMSDAKKARDERNRQAREAEEE